MMNISFFCGADRIRGGGLKEEQKFLLSGKACAVSIGKKFGKLACDFGVLIWLAAHTATTQGGQFRTLKTNLLPFVQPLFTCNHRSLAGPHQLEQA